MNGDTLDEDNETVGVRLSAPANGTLGDGLGSVTITDDDPLAVAALGADTTVTEGNAGSTAVVFTVTLTGERGRTVVVTYSTADGTAQAPGDYTAASGALTFAPNETTKTVTVNVSGRLHLRG